MTQETIEALRTLEIHERDKDLNIEWMLETLVDLKKSLKAIKKNRKNPTAYKEATTEAIGFVNSIIGHLPCKSGMTCDKMFMLIETTACYKCGCGTGNVVQWLSTHTGRAIKQYAVVCSNCWNLNAKANSFSEAVKNHNNIAKTYNVIKSESNK